MNVKNNIKSPEMFQIKLQEIMEGIYDLLELSKENNLAPVNEDGVTRYMEESGKSGFQVSGQFDRPSEYLQSLLDIIRVNYEPCFIGTFFLNSNMGFLYDRIPESPFQISYISLTSENNMQFDLFWNEYVVPHIEKCGYSIKDASVMYAVASTGEEKYGMNFVHEILTTLDSGFSEDEVVNLLAASILETTENPTKKVYSGFCLDPALENKIRLSLWLFTNHHEYVI